MKTKVKLYIQFMLLLLSLSSVSCTQGSFSRNEKEIIDASGGGIMKLWTTDAETDSLFLREPSKELSNKHIKSSEFTALKAGMLSTVNDPENRGVGIAAPQVGIPYRLIAVQRFDKEGEPFEFYINPRVTRYSETRKPGMEGCLSVPGVNGVVERSDEIEIGYTDEKTGGPVSETVKGYTAIIFQHEIDHLDGILFTDRVKTPAQ